MSAGGLVLFTSLAVVWALAWMAFGAPRRLLFGWKPRVLNVSMSDSQGVAFLLIHGTFARAAKWPTAGHEFTNSLIRLTAPASIARLEWSGDNHHSVRVEAAQAAVEWIHENSGYRRIYLVGHSHGGTIAAMAAALSESDKVHVVTMSTPYIHARGRNFANLEVQARSDRDDFNSHVARISYVTTCGFLLAALIALAWIIFEPGWLVPEVGSIILVGWPVIFRSLSNSTLVRRDLAHLQDRAAEISESVNLKLKKDVLHIFRTPGDEASGLLAVSQMAAWFAKVLVARVSRIAFWIRQVEAFIDTLLRVRLVWIMLAPVILSFAFSYGAPAALLWSLAVWVTFRFRLVSSPLEGVLTTLLLPILYLCYLPFGADLARWAPYALLTAETTPPGVWTVQVVNFRYSDELAHSLLYESDHCVRFIASELASPPVMTS